MSRYITIVKGNLKNDNLKENEKIHNMIFEPLKALGTSLGAIAHKAYINPVNEKEFVGIDTWATLEGAQQLFTNPQLANEFSKLFAAMPEIYFFKETEWASFDNQ